MTVDSLTTHIPSVESGHGVKNRIRVIREVRGLSLEAMVSPAGITNQQISLPGSSKRRLTKDWFTRLASALHCHPGGLVSRDATVSMEGASASVVAIAKPRAPATEGQAVLDR